MRQKTKGIIVIIVGMYLVVMNPIISMIFFQLSEDSFGIEITHIQYWLSWFNIYGSITLIFVIIGAYMIRIGIINLKLEKLPDR
ncbi:MAG: hypothetical protein EU533_06565 [Promethearchaeota archaeon]|nr:MAG: hypothetical protein EU533_06565 [Candidatus Lokiarchaeota archaeon]